MNKFTAFISGVLDHCIDDDSLKEYFSKVQDDKNNAVLDTTVGGSYEDCTYA